MNEELIVSRSENDIVIERNPPGEINQHIIVPEHLAEELIERIADEADEIRAVDIQTD